MVDVKHELGGAAAVKQEETEATGNGGQQLASADRRVLGLGNAGAGNVAGAVDVKADVTEEDVWTKNFRREGEEDEGGGAGGGGGGKGPRWKWIGPAEVGEQPHGGGRDEKR